MKYLFHSLLFISSQWKGQQEMSKLIEAEWRINGSDNGLSPAQWQAIIWTNAGILLIGSLGKNFSGILIKIHTFSFEKMHLKMLSGKWRPFCLGLSVLIWHTFASFWHLLKIKLLIDVLNQWLELYSV